MIKITDYLIGVFCLKKKNPKIQILIQPKTLNISHDSFPYFVFLFSGMKRPYCSFSVFYGCPFPLFSPE